MITRVPITVDVSASVATGGRHELAATVFLPDVLDGRPAVLFCAHGGTYTRRYWDFESATNQSYSFGRHLAGHGKIVVAWDALGTGDSSATVDPWRTTSVENAHAAHLLVNAVSDGLADGTLAGRLGPQPSLSAIGVGHSLGGMTVVRQQGRFHSYDAVCVLGWTNLDHPLSPYIRQREPEAQAALEALCARHPPEEAEQRLQTLRGLPQMRMSDEYREAQRAFFYADDVPEEVIAVDRSQARWRGGAMWLSSRIPGIVHADAARIRQPVLLGYGERDLSSDPSREPDFYRQSPEVSLHLLRGSAHCHNFASTRTQQWERIAQWVDGLAP